MKDQKPSASGPLRGLGHVGGKSQGDEVRWIPQGGHRPEPAPTPDRRLPRLSSLTNAAFWRLVGGLMLVWGVALLVLNIDGARQLFPPAAGTLVHGLPMIALALMFVRRIQARRGLLHHEEPPA